MTYSGIAWPGLTTPIKMLNAGRARHVRMLKMVQEHPKLYKRPLNVKRTAQEAIAQYDAALKVLRDAQRAAEAPPKPRRVRSHKATVADAMAGKILP